MVHYNEGLNLPTLLGACQVSKKYASWAVDQLKYLPTIQRERNVSRRDEPFFVYRKWQNCLLHTTPLIRAGLDGVTKLQLKFGIYNVSSRWLLRQPDNLDWIARNNITFMPLTRFKRPSNGAVSSKLGTPLSLTGPQAT